MRAVDQGPRDREQGTGGEDCRARHMGTKEVIGYVVAEELAWPPGGQPPQGCSARPSQTPMSKWIQGTA